MKSKTQRKQCNKSQVMSYCLASVLGFCKFTQPFIIHSNNKTHLTKKALRGLLVERVFILPAQSTKL